MDTIILNLAERYRIGGEKAESELRAKELAVERIVSLTQVAFDQDMFQLNWQEVAQAIEAAGEKQWWFHYKRLCQVAVSLHEPEAASKVRQRTK